MRMTALEIIRQAAVELGLPSPTEVAASLESTGQQMLALLNSAGKDILVAHAWQELSYTYTFSATIGEDEYVLPSGFGYIVDQTFWNSSQQFPIMGPLSPQEWQQLTVGQSSLAFREAFRIQQGNIQLYPAPSSADGYTYQYVTENWVEDGVTSGTYKSAITMDADTPRTDGNLLVKALKVKMWNAKGLDTTSLTEEFGQLFNMLIGKTKGAPVLSLTRRPGNPYLSNCNVPESGLG
jgi:hypothetical protein